jgi:hypothetical protein
MKGTTTMRVMGKALLSLSFLLAFASLGWAKTYAPEQRFIQPKNEESLGTRHVVVTEALAAEVPADVTLRLQRLLHECVKDTPDISSLKFYSYVSDRNRKYHLPPNYLVDFSQLVDKKMKPCSDPLPVCQDRRCLLAGYTMTETGEWERGLSFNVSGWQMAVTHNPKEPKVPLTYFQIRSADPMCQKRGGKVMNGECLQNYIWPGADAEPFQSY